MAKVTGADAYKGVGARPAISTRHDSPRPLARP